MQKLYIFNFKQFGLDKFYSAVSRMMARSIDDQKTTVDDKHLYS